MEKKNESHQNDYITLITFFWSGKKNESHQNDYITLMTFFWSGKKKPNLTNQKPPFRCFCVASPAMKIPESCYRGATRGRRRQGSNERPFTRSSPSIWNTREVNCLVGCANVYSIRIFSWDRIPTDPGTRKLLLLRFETGSVKRGSSWRFLGFIWPNEIIFHQPRFLWNKAI